MNINRLLEDISIRHACKNVNAYAAELEKSLNIKLKFIGDFEFAWSKDFEWCTDAADKIDIILDYFKKHKPKMFSVKDKKIVKVPTISDYYYRLSFTFKFHPENAV